MASALSRAKRLAARTVHIKISPTPQNLSESRVVLQELEQKFGEVAMFRSLKYHPTAPVQNAATAIFQTESAAKAALDTARHRYGLVLEPDLPITSFVGPPIPPLQPEVDPEEAAKKPQEPPKVKEFQIDIWRSDFVHEKYIKSPSTNPLYGSFKPISPDNSFIGGILMQSVPPSPWAKGLMDWETDEIKRKWGNAELDADSEGVEDTVGSERTQNYATNAYLRRRQLRQKKSAPRAMLGLKALVQERQEREEQVKQLRADEEKQAEADGGRGAQKDGDVETLLQKDMG